MHLYQKFERNQQLRNSLYLQTFGEEAVGGLKIQQGFES